MSDISDTADYIDVRDVIERVEELQAARTEYDEHHGTPGAWAKIDDGEPQELQTLTDLLAELKGNGGDHEWEGAWYPIGLIRDSYFEDYARELAEDCGAISRNSAWPLQHIDWKAAAEALQQDYMMVDYGQSTYWYR